MMTIKEFKQWFDEQFYSLLEIKIGGFAQHSDSDSVRKIVSYLATFAQGGKRFRPYMAYIGYTVEGGEEAVFPLYAAIELLHLFCLVHDDIMDNEAVRHGTLTVHRHIETTYHDAEVGRAIAILLGDLLLAWAYECLESVDMIEPYTIDEASQQFRIALSEVIHGQMLDVLSVMEKDRSKDMIEKSMILKSARYSFFHPLYIGMLLAGADEELKEFAEDYAVNLGMAFQLRDDIADLSSDIADGQQTLLTWYLQHVAEASYKETFEKTYFGNDWSEEDEQKLMKLLRDSGVLPFAEHEAEQYFLNAEDAIFAHDKTGEEVWQEIIAEIKRVV